MDSLIHDMHRYWAVTHGTINLKLKQRGGKDDGSADGTIYVNKHPITYREELQGLALFIYAGNVSDYTPCFTLEFTPGSTVAELKTVDRRAKCFTDGHKESRDIVRAAYLLARDRGITRIVLHDLSYIYCPDEARDKIPNHHSGYFTDTFAGAQVSMNPLNEVRLADLSFLSTGRTWYESIFPEMRVIDMPDIEEYRQRVRTNTWRQVGHDLLPDVDINGIDIDEPGSAMAVIAALKDSRDFCKWFSRNINKLVIRSGIHPVTGTHWQIPVRRRATSRRRTASSRRHTRKLTNGNRPNIPLSARSS